jgi:transcription antitermination factor NusG
MTNWYVLYTTPRAEKQLAERLTKMGVICFLPLHKTPRKWSDRVKMVEMPLFPSYLFVYTQAENIYNILKVQGAVRFVWFEGKPAILDKREIDAIKEFLTYAEGKECRYEIDEELKIAFGPLTNKVGKLKKIHSKHLVLMLEKTGMQVMVELDKVVKHRTI